MNSQQLRFCCQNTSKITYVITKYLSPKLTWILEMWIVCHCIIICSTANVPENLIESHNHIHAIVYKGLQRQFRIFSNEMRITNL